jgi:hypothetical protein
MQLLCADLARVSRRGSWGVSSRAVQLSRRVADLLGGLNTGVGQSCRRCLVPTGSNLTHRFFSDRELFGHLFAGQFRLAQLSQQKSTIFLVVTGLPN